MGSSSGRQSLPTRWNLEIKPGGGLRLKRTKIFNCQFVDIFIDSTSECDWDSGLESQ